MSDKAYISNDVWSNEDTSLYGNWSRSMPSEIYTSSIDIDFKLEEELGWAAAFLRLEQIKGYQDNWDGEGSDKPEQANITSSEEFLNVMRSTNIFPPSRISVGPDGEILIEWQSLGKYLEAEISEPFVVELMLVLEGENPLHLIYNIKEETSEALIIAQERPIPEDLFIDALCA